MTFNHKYQKVARDLTNFVRDNVEEEFHIVDGVKKVTLKIRHFNDSDKGKVVNEVMNHIRKHAETIRKQLLDVFYPDQKRDREDAEERVKQKLKDFDEEMDKKRRMAELHEKQMAQQRKWQQNPFVKFFNAIIPKKENLKESQNHIVEEKLNDPLPNQQEPAEPEQQSENNPQDEEQPTQEESINSSIPKSLTLKDLLKFHQLSMLMGAAAIARDMFLHVSPECTLYIFVVRVMPAYRATTNPLAHCEEDFMSYDYLKRLEAIAFYGLPEELRSGLFEQLHKRHTKWFKEGIEYQGTYAKEIMNQTTSLHSYIKNDYWLAFGMEGPSSVDADPHLNYYKQKLKNGANNTQFDLVDLPITDFGQGGDGGD